MRNWNRKTSSSKLSSVSISFSTAAKGNFNHNRRTNSKVPENVDPTRTAFNKILIDKDIRQVYKEVFGEALAEYNANQVAKNIQNVRKRITIPQSAMTKNRTIPRSSRPNRK